MSLFKQSMLALAAGGLAAGLLAFAEPGFRAADAATEPMASATRLQPVSAFAKVKNQSVRWRCFRKPAR
jgi:hypothetical protein